MEGKWIVPLWMYQVSRNTTLNTAYTVGHTLYSVGKLNEKRIKMDKICQYGWKSVEMDENMIAECMNPQYWWTYSICCVQCSCNKSFPGVKFQLNFLCVLCLKKKTFHLSRQENCCFGHLTECVCTGLQWIWDCGLHFQWFMTNAVQYPCIQCSQNIYASMYCKQKRLLNFNGVE